MGDDSSFNAELERIRRGDPEAATRVWQRFSHRLLALAQSRLDRLTRQKVDPEDVVNSAFKSVFRRLDEFELANWNSFLGLLIRVTVRKCGRQQAHYRADKRDVGREVSLASPHDESGIQWKTVSQEPTPSHVVMLEELVKQIMDTLVERDRQIFQLALQRFTPPEISDQVGCTERTVRRVLGRIRDRLEGMREEDAAP